MPKLRFKDREDAGQQLGAELRSYAKERPIVIALPHGGVPIGFEVSRALGAPLDVWVVKKIGVPWFPAVGAGAIAEGGQLSISRRLIDEIGLTGMELAQATETAQGRDGVGAQAAWRPATRGDAGKNGDAGRRRHRHGRHHPGGGGSRSR